jgi:hypothetical protein
MLTLAACSRLRDELLGEGIRVALAIGSRELDLIASVEFSDAVGPSAWIPIKIVAAGADELVASLEDVRPSGLVIALVCRSGKAEAVQAFAFTPTELIVVKMIALMKRRSEPRSFERVDPTGVRELTLPDEIEPFAISPGQWRTKLLAMLKDAS